MYYEASVTKQATNIYYVGFNLFNYLFYFILFTMTTKQMPSADEGHEMQFDLY